jgi:choline kinase
MSIQTPRVVHLAAGQGKRLRPITNDRPKPLVELDGQSLLERNVETLRAAGVDDQLVVTGYCADQIRDLGHDTVHNEYYDETEMVYSLFCAAEQFPENRDLLISYGDILYAQSTVNALLSCEAPICVVIDREWRDLWTSRFDDPLEDAEKLRVDENNRIREIGATPKSYDEIEGQYIGLIKIRQDHLDTFVEVYEELSEGRTTSVEMTTFIQHMIELGLSVQAVPIDGHWLEVDTITDLEYYQDSLKSGTDEPHLAWLQARD